MFSTEHFGQVHFDVQVKPVYISRKALLYNTRLWPRLCEETLSRVRESLSVESTLATFYMRIKLPNRQHLRMLCISTLNWVDPATGECNPTIDKGWPYQEGHPSSRANFVFLMQMVRRIL